MPSPDPPAHALRPLYEVWLKPRKVFRALTDQPIGRIDFLMSAAQGMVGWLAFSRMQNLGATNGLPDILAKSASLGAISGIAGVWVQAWIYAWLGRRAGGRATQAQVIHVLAYGSAPLALSLLVWLLACALLGSGAIVEVAPGETDAFVALLMHVQIGAHIFLVFWSGLLQIMGLSEVNGVPVRGALGIWLLGQLVAVLAMVAIVVLLLSLGTPPPNG